MKIEQSVMPNTSIKETLKAMMKDLLVWQECSKPANDSLSADVLSDVTDESIFKSNPLFKEEIVSLKLIFSFKVVKPLGSAKRNISY